MRRKLTGENFTRHAQYGSIWYRLERHWHTLENDHRLHYIHVYRGQQTRPSKRWAWIEFAEDSPERRAGKTWRWA